MGTDASSNAADWAQFADRVDLIVADAHAAGLGTGAVILAQMAGLLRSLGSSEADPRAVKHHCEFRTTP